jgi:hypothetical protein
MDKLELITICTNPMPVLAKEVQRQNMDHAQWWMVNEDTLSAMEMYNVEENNYAILVNNKGMIFYSGRQDDVDIKNQIILMLKGKNPTQNIALSSKSKLDRRLLSVTSARYMEIKEFFRTEFLPRINKFKEKYDIGKFNSYWLDYSIRFTKTALVSGELATTKYFCIDFHVKTIEPVYHKLLQEFPGIGELLTNQPGCNFLKIILRYSFHPTPNPNSNIDYTRSFLGTNATSARIPTEPPNIFSVASARSVTAKAAPGVSMAKI